MDKILNMYKNKTHIGNCIEMRGILEGRFAKTKAKVHKEVVLFYVKVHKKCKK